jgi:hypothetical protein
MLSISRHAEKRCNQRGIKQSIVEFVLAHADRDIARRGGCTAYTISNRHLDELRGEFTGEVERARNVIIYMGETGQFVMAFRARKRRRARSYRRSTEWRR